MSKRTIIGFLKLIRWFHVLLSIFPFVTLFLIVRSEAEKYGIFCKLSIYGFVVMSVSVQLLVAAGCVLNDICDRDIDRINKPTTHIVGRIISLRNAWIIFITLSGLIVLLTFYIATEVFTEWILITPTVYLLSVAYDLYLKRSPLFGNIFMGLITAAVPLTILWYAGECIAQLPHTRIEVLATLYAAYPFLVIIPRELSLDISDIEGDRSDGCITLPIMIGVSKSRILVVVLILLIPVLSVPVMSHYPYLSIPLVVADLMLLIYLFLFRKCTTRIDYIRAGRFLWFTMILGLIGFTLASVL